MSKKNSHMKLNEIRSQFPILNQKINNHPLVYLDSASTTQKPISVINRIKNFYEKENSNVHRGVHKLSVDATEMYEKARVTVSDFIGSNDSTEVVFLRGATEAINLVCSSYLEPTIKKNEEILITMMEHHANIVPWQLLCKKKGCILKVVNVLKDGSLDVNHLKELISQKTRIFACTHISNATGIINPILEISKICKKNNVPLLIDGSQSTAHIKTNVSDLGCDFFVFSGHKMYGPTGIGALWAKKEILNQMPPWQGGGDMIKSVSFDKTFFNDAPYKFEAGTPNISGAIGLSAAIDFINQIGFSWIESHENTLLNVLNEEINPIKELHIIGTHKNKIPIVSFILRDIPPSDLGLILDQQGIAIRIGHHCAEPLMNHFKISGTARASLSFMNTEDDIKRLSTGINKAIEMFS